MRMAWGVCGCVVDGDYMAGGTMSGHWAKSPICDVPVWVCDNKTAPEVPDGGAIIGTHGVWVEEIGDFDLATVRTPDGLTVMRTEDAKRLYASG